MSTPESIVAASPQKSVSEIEEFLAPFEPFTPHRSPEDLLDFKAARTRLNEFFFHPDVRGVFHLWTNNEGDTRRWQFDWHQYPTNFVWETLKGRPCGLVADDETIEVALLAIDLDRHDPTSIAEFLQLVKAVTQITLDLCPDYRLSAEVNPNNGSAKLFAFKIGERGTPVTIPIKDARAKANEIKEAILSATGKRIEVFPDNNPHIRLPLRLGKINIIDSGVLEKHTYRKKNDSGKFERFESHSVAHYHHWLLGGSNFHFDTFIKAVELSCENLPEDIPGPVPVPAWIEELEEELAGTDVLLDEFVREAEPKESTSLSRFSTEEFLSQLAAIEAEPSPKPFTPFEPRPAPHDRLCVKDERKHELKRHAEKIRSSSRTGKEASDTVVACGDKHQPPGVVDDLCSEPSATDPGEPVNVLDCGTIKAPQRLNAVMKSEPSAFKRDQLFSSWFVEAFARHHGRSPSYEDYERFKFANDLYSGDWDDDRSDRNVRSPRVFAVALKNHKKVRQNKSERPQLDERRTKWASVSWLVPSLQRVTIQNAPDMDEFMNPVRKAGRSFRVHRDHVVTLAAILDHESSKHADGAIKRTAIEGWWKELHEEGLLPAWTNDYYLVCRKVLERRLGWVKINHEYRVGVAKTAVVVFPFDRTSNARPFTPPPTNQLHTHTGLSGVVNRLAKTGKMGRSPKRGNIRYAETEAILGCLERPPP
ncbi:MAG: hypothetical protein H6822_22140 [Planctomycetaceae bacterium]|nr:hypothetical protein [Planctomycetaceae bacterium]